jgi:DNA-binding LacI/PurR family transcriptional regulator
MTSPALSPKYVQLGEELRTLIKEGTLPVGARLPSYAELYRQYGATPATAQRVYDLLEEEGLIERRPGSGVYVAEARQTLTGNIGFIGNTMHGRAGQSPFYNYLMDGVQRVLQEERRQLLYLGHAGAWDAEALKKVDGILLCNVEAACVTSLHIPPHIPRVSLLTLLEGVVSVGVDDYRGAQMAIRHLMEHGHRRIACLMEEFLSEGRRRVAGYLDTLIEAGVEPDPAWARLTDTVFHEGSSWQTAQPYREWGQREMSAWLKDGWCETGCTAILVQNEVAAIGVMQALQAEGIRVPQEVSVMTFDGTELCDLVSPCLSAVAVPLDEIGARAMKDLNKQIAGEAPEVQHVLLPLGLRSGGSVGAAPT